MDPLGLTNILSRKQIISIAQATARINVWDGAIRSGKLLSTDTLIPVPSGWKKLGEIEPGDYVFSHAGDPVCVLAVHDGIPETAYRLTFSDGGTLDACADHLWATWTHVDRTSYRRTTGRPDFDAAWPSWRSPGEHSHPEKEKKGPRVRNTQESVDTLLSGRQSNHAIPVCGQLRLPRIETPIDPYLLGAWLGNGSSNTAAITVSDDDAAEMLPLLAAAGAPVIRSSRRPGAKCATYFAGRWDHDPVTHRVTTDIRIALKSLNVLGAKHVPPQYLRASPGQRLALLQGLMDTGGGWSGRHIEFSSTNENLAASVAELARSLGQKPSVKTRRARLHGRDCGMLWRVTWTPTIQVFRLPRKAAKMRTPGFQSELARHHRTIVKAERIEPRPMRCLEVDAHYGLFLAGESMIPTHNTLASLIRFLMDVAAAPRQGEIVVVAKTGHTAARNVFTQLQDPGLFGAHLAGQVSYTPGAPTATVLGRRVWVIGANDARSEQRLRGLTCYLAYCDELSLISQDFFTQLLGRMSVPGAKVLATTNPDNPSHWLRRDYLLRADKLGLRYWHFALDDNPSLTPAYLAAIKTEFTGLWYRRYVLGEWAAAEGAIFDMWDPAEHVFDIYPVSIVMWPAAGIDYGTTNPFAAVLIGLGTDNRLYVTSEWRWDSAVQKRQLTDAQYSEHVRLWLQGARIPRTRLSGVSPDFVVVDPSAASFKAQLYQDGMPSVDGDNSVVDGIRLLSTLLAQGRLRVHSSCRGLIGEMPSYVWDERYKLLGEDRPLKLNDHGVDAVRYGVATTRNLWQPRMAMEM